MPVLRCRASDRPRSGTARRIRRGATSPRFVAVRAGRAAPRPSDRERPDLALRRRPPRRSLGRSAAAPVHSPPPDPRAGHRPPRPQARKLRRRTHRRRRRPQDQAPRLRRRQGPGSWSRKAPEGRVALAIRPSGSGLRGGQVASELWRSEGPLMRMVLQPPVARRIPAEGQASEFDEDAFVPEHRAAGLLRGIHEEV